MTESYGNSPRERQLAAGTRALPQGGGRRLRSLYLTLLLVALAVMALILAFSWYATLASVGNDDLPLVGFGAVVVTAAAVLLVGALTVGRAAVNGDAVAVGAAHTSVRLARVGGLVGWIGSGAVLTIAVALALRGVDLAVVKGVALAGAALVPAFLNDRTRAMGLNAAGGRQS
jgi:hypothetical protein